MNLPKLHSRVMPEYSKESRPPNEALCLDDTGLSLSVEASYSGTEVSEEKHLKKPLSSSHLGNLLQPTIPSEGGGIRKERQTATS